MRRNYSFILNWRRRTARISPTCHECDSHENCLHCVDPPSSHNTHCFIKRLLHEMIFLNQELICKGAFETFSSPCAEAEKGQNNSSGPETFLHNKCANPPQMEGSIGYHQSRSLVAGSKFLAVGSLEMRGSEASNEQFLTARYLFMKEMVSWVFREYNMHIVL